MNKKFSEELQTESEPRPEAAFIIHVIPQAHIDLLWFWTPAEGVRMVLETLRAHADVLDANPDFTFAHSQAWSYDLVRRNDPELFGRIKRLVANGQWEPVGGEWVEADPAIPGYEARIRQFFYGQRFFEEHFGRKSTVAWCPDGFTFLPSSLPQILIQAGMNLLIHKRPRERYGHLPLSPYRWIGQDGSEIVTYRSNNKGIGLPVLSEGTQSAPDQTDLSVVAQEFEKFGIRHIWGPMGIGDVGGVNNYELPETSSSFIPFFSTPSRFLQEALTLEITQQLPTVSGSLPYEFTGCFTTWASVKTLNRKVETILQQVDFLAAITQALRMDVDCGQIDEIWKRMLYFQFHDSICGCGTEDIKPFVEQGYISCITEADTLKNQLMRSIAESVEIDSSKGIPVTVFNPLGWKRSSMVESRVTLGEQFMDLVPADDPLSEIYSVDCRNFVPDNAVLEAVDSDGNVSPAMVLKFANIQSKRVAYVRFQANELPPFGYKTFYLRKSSAKPVEINERLVAEFDLASGGISRLRYSGDDQLDFRTSSGVLGQLCIHETGNYPIDYDREHRAWHAAFTGNKTLLEPISHEVQTLSGNRKLVRFHYSYSDSHFTQEFLIEPDAGFVEVTLSGDWQEVEKYLKVHFAFDTQNPVTAFADMTYGFTEQLPECAEYGMQYFCGIRDNNKALLVLNDSRYGCLWKDGSLSLSAIRCATWPAMISDKGEFGLRYRIMALRTDGPEWQSDAFKAGFDFNIAPCSYAQDYTSGQISSEWSLLPSDHNPVLVNYLKPSVDVKGLVMRLFNAIPEASTHNAVLPLGYETITQCTILEESIADRSISDGESVQFHPYEIKSLLIT